MSRSGWVQPHSAVILQGRQWELSRASAGMVLTEQSPRISPTWKDRHTFFPSVEGPQMGQRQRDRGQTFPDVGHISAVT